MSDEGMAAVSQESAKAPAPSVPSIGVEVLSDTRGVDFSPYLNTIIHSIRDRWIVLLPGEAHPPTAMKGETDIRFTILPDGTVSYMHLDASTHHIPLDRAAWGAIATSKLGTLPAGFIGPNLELRLRFRVNLDALEASPAPAH
jgi:outer membrane biosynthesis protein TonB